MGFYSFFDFFGLITLEFLFSFSAVFAFTDVTTFLPVCVSNSNRATFATFPPRLAIFELSSKVSGFTVCEISLVEAYASILKISSVFVILSSRFSFFNPLRILYSLVVLPDQALVIMSVKVAN